MRTKKQLLWQIWRMILWREWRVNRCLILNLFGLWLVVTLVLPVFVRTTPVILTCVMLGQLLAVRLAGGDSGWGSEAFSLSLPPSRGAYFWIRFLFGIVVVEMFLFVGHFATLHRIGPQMWGLVVESGVTDGAFFNDGFDSWLRAYGLVMGSYAVTFAITANHGESRWTVDLYQHCRRRAGPLVVLDAPRRLSGLCNRNPTAGCCRHSHSVG
ncbi:MAG: hypothetical protein O3C21_13310 [Verrucomicrobia bacterium]|nr:hypothetical protein [Verrucomicrobiota bacterium]